jgi:hypothetical protein
MRFCILLLLFFALKGAAQNITNKSVVVVRPGTIMTVKGNSVNSSGGSFSVNGELRVSGNLEDHDAKFGFAGAAGKVLLNGKDQAIGCSLPLYFPILELEGGIKTLK